VSGIEFFVGYALSVAVGIPLGIATGWYKRFFYLLDPYISALYATPRVALLPLIIIWVGIGIWSKIVVVFLGAVFPMTAAAASTSWSSSSPDWGDRRSRSAGRGRVPRNGEAGGSGP